MDARERPNSHLSCSEQPTAAAPSLPPFGPSSPGQLDQVRWYVLIDRSPERKVVFGPELFVLERNEELPPQLRERATQHDPM